MMEFSRDVLTQLKSAVNEPLKRKIIGRDATIIGGLVLVLSNVDKKIVIDALEILLSLAASVENKEFLRDFIGMKEQLKILSAETNLIEHARELSKQLQMILTSEESVNNSGHLRTRPANISHNSSSTMLKKPQKQGLFLNPSRCKTITLQIKGLNDKHDMEACREKILTVRGVVSITFDLHSSRSILRVKPELCISNLAKAIHSTQTMVAEQVIRSENGEEKFVSLVETESNKENNLLPAYLPDDDSPVKDEKAVRRFGVEDNKKEESWLSSAANFLSRSFYW